MNIVIGADFIPTKTNESLFAASNIEGLIGGELFAVLKSADFAIFNLECPFSDDITPIAKCGPALCAPKKCFQAYKSAGVHLLNLANNHIMDQGEQGLLSTIELLRSSGIQYLGAGRSLVDAARPYIFECEGHKIGIYSCAEHEYSIVTEQSAGANPIDLLETPDHIALLKDECDYVIVLYHGGREEYRYPSPGLQKVCRKFVQKGADLVICQHSHCIGAKEEYRNGTIVYGQGNFLFDGSDDECWQTGLLIQIVDGFHIQYIPLKKEGNTVRIAGADLGRTILSDFEKRSQEILDPHKVQDKYNTLAKEKKTELLMIASGTKFGIVMRILNKLTGYRLSNYIMKRRFTPKKKMLLHNRITCEAYQELFATSLLMKEKEPAE